MNKINKFISDKPFASILILILLHMLLSNPQYNLALNYLSNRGLFELFQYDFYKGIFGWFLYASSGMLFSLLIFSPFIYWKYRNIYNAIISALSIGLFFRILSYFTAG